MINRYSGAAALITLGVVNSINAIRATDPVVTLLSILAAVSLFVLAWGAMPERENDMLAFVDETYGRTS